MTRFRGLLLLVLAGLFFTGYGSVVMAQLHPLEKFKGNEDALASEMVKAIQQVKRKRYPDGKFKRFNQAKSLGCFDAQFTVNDNVPDWLAVGLFAEPATYPALVRFASASTTDDEEPDLRGASVRVFDVVGDMVWGETGKQDFVLNSYPALFADSPETFLKFIHAQRDDSLLWFFLNPFDAHLSALMLLLDARDNHSSPFDLQYWSTTPYQLGKDNVVKYSMKSCSNYTSDLPDSLSDNYLRANMKQHLESEDVCFDFMLQLRNSENMSVEDASDIWEEAESSFIPVAELRFSHQPFLDKTSLEACETVSFNPWQSLAAHKPIGRMNYVRRVVYEALSKIRQQSHNK